MALYSATVASLEAGLRPHGISPERVAKAIAHALTSRRPRTRYVVGLDASLTRLVQRLPDRVRDASSGHVFGGPTNVLSVFFGFMSAIVWGAGDFAGGIASRKTGAFRVVLFAEVVGLLVLTPVALSVGEAIPDSLSWMQAALAGGLGTLGLVLLYHAWRPAP